jgi:hypothetical protein
MPGYWWQCIKCRKEAEFRDIRQGTGIVPFIQDKMIASDWDQGLLLRKCPHCGRRTFRITYEFPGREITLQVVHIVGLNPTKKRDTVPMMWETYSTSDSEERWLDFKYINSNNTNQYGLNKPSVMTREELLKLFELYRQKTGDLKFPQKAT